MADTNMLPREPARGLFRTPILTHLTLDQRLGPKLNAGGDMLEFALFSSLLCLLGTITTLAAVALHFARDDRGMNPDSRAISSCDQSAFQAGVNLVSLLLGKLSITHLCFS